MFAEPDLGKAVDKATFEAAQVITRFAHSYKHYTCAQRFMCTVS